MYKETQKINSSKIKFTTDPEYENNYCFSELYNCNKSNRCYFHTDCYLPPETLILVELVQDQPDESTTNHRCLPARVDWCIDRGGNYEIAINFVNKHCEQCYEEVKFGKIYTTEEANILCEKCYYTLQNLNSSILKNCIQDQLLGNVL